METTEELEIEDNKNVNALLFHQNWSKLEIPKKIQFDLASKTDSYGKFIIDPLYKGFGITIGHSLKRVLLSSLVSTAVYAVKIEGINNEYESIRGIREDVLQIILNIKELIFNINVSDDITLKLSAKGPKLVTAGDIQTSAFVSLANKDKVICSLDDNVSIDITFYLKMNRGFVSSEENYTDNMPIGTIFIDSNHSPIEKIKYEIQDTKLGKKADHDKLIFELWTNGCINPTDAVCYAAKILIDYYKSFINFEEDSIVVEKTEKKVLEQEENHNLNRNINELELSVRSAHCLNAINIKTIRDLVQKTENNMLKTKNFGRKSLKEIKSILTSMDLSLGMTFDETDNIN